VRKPKDLKRLELENFGKYWQTVRDMKPLALDFENVQLTQLLERIRASMLTWCLRRKWLGELRNKLFQRHQSFCEVLGGVLKPKGYAVIVVGNSILQGVRFLLITFLQASPDGTASRQRISRVAPEARRRKHRRLFGAPRGKSKGPLYESAVVLQRAE